MRNGLICSGLNAFRIMSITFSKSSHTRTQLDVFVSTSYIDLLACFSFIVVRYCVRAHDDPFPQIRHGFVHILIEDAAAVAALSASIKELFKFTFTPTFTLTCIYIHCCPNHADRIVLPIWVCVCVCMLFCSYFVSMCAVHMLNHGKNWKRIVNAPNKGVCSFTGAREMCVCECVCVMSRDIKIP